MSISRTIPIPEVIIFSCILPKLPPSSLVRFRAVCKSWETEINSQDFAKRYRVPILVFFDGLEGKLGVVGLETPNPTVWKFPLTNPSRGWIKIVGCCNGLVVVQEEPSYEIAILNPYFPSCHQVPDTPFFGLAQVQLGFGYDSFHDDYKIVKIVPRSRWIHSESGTSRVYSMGSGSWGRPKPLPSKLRCDLYISSGPDNCVTVNNALHWIARKRLDGGMTKESLLVAFDLKREKLRVIQLPDCGGENTGNTLANWHGHLCAVRDRGHFLDIWMMLEYGVGESWTLVHRATLPAVLLPARIRMLGFPEDGVKVLLEFDEICGNRYVWFDIANSSFKELPALDIPEGSEVYASAGSLVRAGVVAK